MDCLNVEDLRAQVSGLREQLESERAYFRSVFEGMGEGLLITDLDDRIEFVNGRMAQMCGFSREEMVGKLAYEVLLPRDEWPQLHGRNERRAQGLSDVYETLLQRKDGERFWCRIHATPLRDAAGNVVGTIGAQLDITKRKHAEMALRQSEERLRSVVQHAVDGFIVHDFEGQLLEVNAQICESLGYSREELLSMNVRDFEVNFLADGVAQKWDELRRGGARATVDGRQKRRDGTTLPVEVRVGCVEWNGTDAVLALVRDVSERQAREAARRELEARFQSVVGAASDAIVLTDAKGKIVLWNDGARQIFGWSAEESEELSVVQLMPERFRAAHLVGIARVAAGGQCAFEGQVLSLVGERKDGREFPLEMTLGVWRDGDTMFYASVMRDVSERARLERELRGALWERRLIMEAVPDVLFRLDLNGQLVAWNRELERVTGFSPEELQDRPAISFFDLPFQGVIAGAIERSLRGEQVEIEAPMLNARGVGTPYSFSSVPLLDEEGTLLGLAGTGRDMTERHAVEEQTRNSLREKEVLLKEIHHRVKNNLQIINSLLSMQGEALGDARIKAAFSESQNRVRAMALIHETLYLAGDLGRIDMRAYCKRLAGALLRGYGETVPDVSMEVEVPDGLFLPLDAAVPCGLIINELVTNSFKYGFPDGRGGTIGIDVAQQNGSQWTLRVGDDGVGLPDFCVETVTSTGLQLVTGLCDQLEASYHVERERGTQWTISFITA